MAEWICQDRCAADSGTEKVTAARNAIETNLLQVKLRSLHVAKTGTPSYIPCVHRNPRARPDPTVTRLSGAGA